MPIVRMVAVSQLHILRSRKKLRMATTPFTVGPVEFRVGNNGHSSIFTDVEEAKQRFIEIRKSLRSRNDAGSSNKGLQSTSSNTPNQSSRDLDNYRAILRLLLESETDLSETRSKRLGLEKRREDLKEAIISLRSEIELAHVHKNESVSEPEESGVMEIKQPERKRQRYFESSENLQPPAAIALAKESSQPVDANSDDLSTVVCPFELLGRCTDPTCPHMHLDR